MGILPVMDLMNIVKNMNIDYKSWDYNGDDY